MIPVDSECHSIWQIFIGMMSLGSCVCYAYFAAFAFPYHFTSLSDFLTNFYEHPSDNGFTLFWFFVEVVFAVDIVLHFLKEYRSEINHQTVSDLRLIANRYLRTTFLLDFLATLPINLLVYLFSGRPRITNDDTFDSYRLLYVMKMVRVLKATEIMSAKFIKGIIDQYFKRKRDQIIEYSKHAHNFHFDPMIDYNQILE